MSSAARAEGAAACGHHGRGGPVRSRGRTVQPPARAVWSRAGAAGSHQCGPSGRASRDRRAVTDSLMSTSAGEGSGPSSLLRTRADRRPFSPRQSTRSGPASGPPAPPRTTWSATRSAEGWAGWSSRPGHQSPTVARWSATRRRRRSVSAWVRMSGRRAALARSRLAVQPLHLGLPRTCLAAVEAGAGEGLAHRGLRRLRMRSTCAHRWQRSPGPMNWSWQDRQRPCGVADAELGVRLTHGCGAGRAGPGCGMASPHPARRPPRPQRRPAPEPRLRGRARPWCG